VQAAYQVRGMLLGLHGGVKMWYIYDFVDDGTSPTDNEHDFGLVRHIRQNYEPKPAFYAIQRIEETLLWVALKNTMKRRMWTMGVNYYEST
jgi:hypothetical protein